MERQTLMGEPASGFSAAIRQLWHTDRALTATGIGMLGLFLIFCAGLLLDSRTVLGAPVWLKPAKFAISIAIYCFTLAWAFGYLPEWRRMRRVVGVGSVVVFLIEIAIIAGQAGRGMTSHFNVATPFDRTLFTIMGAAIVLQTLISVAVAVALWRTTFVDRALGWAMRLGLVVTILGASTGGLMTRPTEGQLAAARETGRMAVAGAHTVGGVDGGPGLPGTGWSAEHGDLRVAHFVGLHGFQLLPLLAVALRRRGFAPTVRSRMVTIAAASYITFFGLAIWQALRGESVVNPDGSTLTALTIWAAATAAALLMAGARRPHVAAGAIV
jgi:hypothetical protein